MYIQLIVYTVVKHLSYCIKNILKYIYFIIFAQLSKHDLMTKYIIVSKRPIVVSEQIKYVTFVK